MYLYLELNVSIQKLLHKFIGSVADNERFGIIFI